MQVRFLRKQILGYRIVCRRIIRNVLGIILGIMRKRRAKERKAEERIKYNTFSVKPSGHLKRQSEADIGL